MYRDPNPYRDDWSNLICSNELLQPIKVNYTGTPAAYPYYLTMDEYVFNSASSTETGICANTYTPHDAGNQTAIAEAGDFDPSDALATLNDFFEKQLTVTYRIVDTTGRVLEELTAVGQEGQVITEVPAHVSRKAYTTYTVLSPVTLAKGQENVVEVSATWQLPFEVSPNLDNAHWYNLALRGGANYVNAAEGYKCNPVPTRDNVNSPEYQWAFQGDPYDGIVVYNRSDITKTLSKVYSEEKKNDVAVLADGVFKWRLVEGQGGFLLATDGSYPYINEYGGSGGHLGFWGSLTDIGSIFSVSEVGSLKVENVVLPAGGVITVYKSSDENTNQRAVLVIPGGGYAYVAGSSEGSDWAPLLDDLGYTAAVFTYTTPPTAPDGPLTQAREAVQYLRDHGDELHVKTGLVGVMGFSAGGHLASTMATHTTGDERPAFQILFYPVISMDASITHAGSRENLLGKNPSRDLVRLYSNDKQVTAETPMAYLCWADNDGTVPTTNSMYYRNALKKAGVPYHCKNFPRGGHGFGFKLDFEFHDAMVNDLTAWLQEVDGILTAVRDVPVPDTSVPAEYYTLTGQRATPSYRGLVVTHNHKGIVK